MNNDTIKMMTVRTVMLRAEHFQNVYTRVVRKYYGDVYNKRRVVAGLSALPYSYKVYCIKICCVPLV